MKDDIKNTLESFIPKELFKSVLDTGISKLELVNRQEFEVQVRVLAKTREKLECLEAKLNSLEQALSS